MPLALVWTGTQPLCSEQAVNANGLKVSRPLHDKIESSVNICQLLGLATLRFRWKDAGNLVWDYDTRMMRTAPYAELGNRVDLSMTLLALQGIVGAMVLVDAVMSVREAWHALRSLRLKAYLFSPATVLNWTSLAFQGYYVYSGCN